MLNVEAIGAGRVAVPVDDSPKKKTFSEHEKADRWRACSLRAEMVSEGLTYSSGL
jgi:hypothetical protein